MAKNGLILFALVGISSAYEFRALKSAMPKMNSGTAWTIAGGGVPGKPQAACAVLPAFQPSRTMSDLAI